MVSAGRISAGLALWPKLYEEYDTAPALVTEQAPLVLFGVLVHHPVDPVVHERFALALVVSPAVK